MSRDWAATLWPASFKGVPFWTERDRDRFGKRLVVHEFPGRDDPFIEDLAAKAREFEVTAYFVDDAADAEADAFTAAMLQTGPGILVLPAQGPILARAHIGDRERVRDRAGYFGIVAKFYKEGVSVPVQPVDYLAQLVFDAGDALVGAAASLLSTVSLS